MHTLCKNTGLILCVLISLLSLALAADYAPEQIRIQMTGRDETEMVITYTTGSSVSRTKEEYKVPPTRCMFGTSMDKNTTIIGTSHYFEVDKYFADIHQCILPKLTAGVEYFYMVGDAASPNGLSDVFSFRAGPVKKWAVFGDFGWTNMDRSASQLLKDAADGLFDGVLHVGDIAYDLHNGHGKRGDDFMNYLEPITATMPYLLQPGNHEKFENFTHYNNRFASLQHLGDNSDSGTLLWYSFNQPNAHFITFDTEVYSYYPDPGQIERQLRWMEDDLIKYNTPEMRSKYPWIISVAHKCDWQDEVKYNDFRVLLNKYGVDVHICGHQHNYQRLYPGLRSKVDAQPSPNVFVDPPHWVQIVVGSPGCQEKISSGLAPYRDGVASSYFSYGFGALEIVNSTHLLWEWKQTHTADSSKGETLFDQAMIAMQLDNGSKIKDTMTLIQTKHGMRDV